MAKFNETTDAKRSETNMVAPSKIKLPSFTGRKYRAESDIKARAEDMKRNGQLQPVGVRKLEDGTPELIFGFTRHAAGLLLEQENAEFRLEVKTFTPEDAKAAAILTNRENLDRTELSDIDIAHNQEEFRTIHGMSNKEIAAEFKCDPAKVTRLKKLLTLSEMAQHAVHTGSLATAAAIEMASASHETQNAMLEKGITKLSDVVEYIRRLSQAAPVATPVVAAPGVVHVEMPLSPLNLGNPVPLEISSDAAFVPTAEQMPTPDAVGEQAEAQPAALDFSKLNADTAPPKPNAATRQRTVQQVKQVVSRFVGEDTNVVLATFAAAILAYIDGSKSEVELDDIVRTIEGKAPVG